MKVIYKGICVLIMTMSMFFLILSFYVERMYQPTSIQLAIDQIDLMTIVEDQISGEYKKIMDKLKDTKEFQNIVYDYARAFGLYLYNGTEIYTISEAQEKELFTQYSAIFLKQYPQLQILPSHLFVEFLVERIDLNDYLPTFESLKEKIPRELWEYLNMLVGDNQRIKSLLLFIVAYVCFLFLHRRMTLLPISVSLLVSFLILVFVSSGYLLQYLPNEFSSFENVIILFLKELQVEIKYCIMSLVSCLCLEWGIYYAKKIFLF